jgi:hypothetical protein
MKSIVSLIFIANKAFSGKGPARFVLSALNSGAGTLKAAITLASLRPVYV